MSKMHGGKKLLDLSTSNFGLLAVLLIVVCVVVLAVHWPALSAQALSFDDSQYLVKNLLVQNPSWTSARRFLTEVLEPSTVGGYYQPLTMISLMFDYALGGRPDNLHSFHRTSLILHVVNTALVIVLLYLLFGQAWVAAAVGLLFGLHPMTVEPIPWVGERKTLLAAFFALWCLILYVRYARKPNRPLYIGCLAMYVLALISKPTSTPLPLLMLLMDYWPLRRWKWTTVLEKLPFFVVGGISAIITYISQSSAAPLVVAGGYGLKRIPLVLCHNIIFYLHKIIWPANLSSHYVFPEPFGLSDPMVLAGVIGTCILLPLLVISLRWTRAALVGWLFFFVAIFPTTQVLRFSTVIAADRFAYLPSVGLLMVVASLLCWFCGTGSAGKSMIRRMAVAMTVLVLASAEAVATRSYLVHWRDTMSLSEHILTKTPDAPQARNMLGLELQSQGKLDQAIGQYRRALQVKPNYVKAHNNLGNALQSRGKLDEAISHYRRALQIDPGYAEAYYNMGITFRAQGRHDEAINCYRQALRLKPNYLEAHNNLGNALQSLGRLDEAIMHFHQSLQIKPDSAEVHYNLGLALKSQGDFDDAIKHFRQALQLNPDLAEAHNNLALVLTMTGQLDKALEHFRQALQIKPDFAEVHYNMGLALKSQGKLDEAIKHFRQALQVKPDLAETHNNLALALTMTGQLDKALEHFREAVRLKPDYLEPLNRMARILAMHPEPKLRDPNQAIEIAKRAVELTGHKDAAILETLAAAYAAAGQFDQAVKTAEAALSLATAAQADELANHIRKQIQIYRQAKP
jgi:tetratricopeptide (TPR) repeat protein